MALESQIDAAARGATKPVVGRVFRDYLDTVTDASQAQWATFTVDVIGHARRTKMPRRELLDLLGAFGLVETPPRPVKREPGGRARRRRGRCPACRRRVNLRSTGVLGAHPTREGGHDRCDGSYGPPVAVAGSEAVAS